MANAENAQVCAREICAESQHKFWRFWSGWKVFGWLKPAPKLPPLSDHLARDIGLDAADLEIARLKLPSQTTHHPYG